MAAAVPYNRVRFDAYRRCACEFVTGETYDCNELANMLHDLRWVEVPRAFSVALYNAARKGPLRPGLARNFKELLEYVTFLAFGSAERDVVQPWYLKNWDDFFVSCVEGILSLNNRTDDVLLQREAVVRRAFAGVLNLVEGARGYMSLDRLKNSTAAHALLVASGHCAHSFVWNGWVQLGGDVDGVPVGCVRDAKRPMTLAHTFLMDEIAASILDTQSFRGTTPLDTLRARQNGARLQSAVNFTRAGWGTRTPFRQCAASTMRWSTRTCTRATRFTRFTRALPTRNLAMSPIYTNVQTSARLRIPYEPRSGIRKPQTC